MILLYTMKLYFQTSTLLSIVFQKVSTQGQCYVMFKPILPLNLPSLDQSVILGIKHKTHDPRKFRHRLLNNTETSNSKLLQINQLSWSLSSNLIEASQLDLGDLWPTYSFVP